MSGLKKGIWAVVALLSLLLAMPRLALAADTCASPTVIAAGGGTVTGTTSGDSLEHGKCGYSKRAPEIVYSWTPNVTGVAVIETCGANTDIDTVLYVRTGTCSTTAGTGQYVACSNNACVNSTGKAKASRVQLNTVAGTTYYIIVDGFKNAEGDFELTVTPDPNGVTTSTTTTTTTTTSTTTTTTTSTTSTTDTSTTTTTTSSTTTTT